MDILSEVLETVRVAGSSGFRAELSAPWGMSVAPTANGAPFYLVSSGTLYLEMRALGEPRLVESGDLVMLPNGTAHTIADSPASPRRPLEGLLAAQLPAGAESDGGPRATVLRFGGTGPTTEIFSGTFWLKDDPTATILRSLGQVIHIRAQDESSPDFASLLGLSCREMRSPTPGSRFVTEELMKLLFIQVLRSAMASPRHGDESCTANPFKLMFHPQMSDVAEAIHLHLDRDWRVEELASMAGMSRTSFALHFAEVTGMSPRAYLTRWRMIKSAQLLRDTSATLAEVASRVGYGSESAFSIAFKREMGVAPGRFRAGQARPAEGRTPPPPSFGEAEAGAAARRSRLLEPLPGSDTNLCREQP